MITTTWNVKLHIFAPALAGLAVLLVSSGCGSGSDGSPGETDTETGSETGSEVGV